MIFLGLGSNLGDKAQNIHQALAHLVSNKVEVKRVSPFYQTAAWGEKEQDDFVNAVAEVAFAGSAHELLDLVLETEKVLGRVRIKKWGPRLIDIDILEFNRQEIDIPGLQIPHPWYPKRNFVVQPFADLEPDWIPTGEKLSLTQLVSNLGREGLERMIEKDES